MATRGITLKPEHEAPLVFTKSETKTWKTCFPAKNQQVLEQVPVRRGVFRFVHNRSLFYKFVWQDLFVSGSQKPMIELVTKKA